MGVSPAYRFRFDVHARWNDVLRACGAYVFLVRLQLDPEKPKGAVVQIPTPVPGFHANRKSSLQRQSYRCQLCVSRGKHNPLYSPGELIPNWDLEFPSEKRT